MHNMTVKEVFFMATPPSKGKLLYHITHMNNMPSILQNGLLSRKEIYRRGIIQFVDAADPEILSKRESYKESLSKYVLFHFYAKNPFDWAVCHRFGPENLAIITIERRLKDHNDFKIIPSHPLDKNEPDILPYDQGFQKIRWDILNMETGRDYNDPEIKKACMAECVMEYAIPPESFAFIFVYDEQAKTLLKGLPYAEKIAEKIKVNASMFAK